MASKPLYSISVGGFCLFACCLLFLPPAWGGGRAWRAGGWAPIARSLLAGRTGHKVFTRVPNAFPLVRFNGAQGFNIGGKISDQGLVDTLGGGRGKKDGG